MTTPLPRRRAGARNGARLSQQAIDAELTRQQAERDAQRAEGVARRKAEREAEKARVKFTAADLAGADAIYDGFTWHRVIRVNAKSVTVATPYSWTERVPIERVRRFQ